MSMTQDEALPCKLGEICRWEFTDTNDDVKYIFQGKLIGQASSHRAKHDHGDPKRAPRQCHACRWISIKIIKVISAPTLHYAVVYTGHSIKDGEIDRVTVSCTESPYTVIEVLSQVRNGEVEPYLPRTARIALTEAAARDTGIELAWIERP